MQIARLKIYLASYNRSVDKLDLKSYIHTQYKASHIFVAACKMCDKMMHNVQKESELERAKNLLKANLLVQLDGK